MLHYTCWERDTPLVRALFHNVTYRSTSYPNGRSASHYHVPGSGQLSVARFNDWLTEISAHCETPPAVSVLAIREYRDANGALHGCILERRRRTAEGEYYGNPARVEVTGAAVQVTAFRATAGGGLREISPRLALPVDPPMRDSLFSGEDRAVRVAYGETTRIVAVREPSALEELVGFSSIVHLLTPDGHELACGIGWHGTTPFLIQGEFPPHEGQSSNAAGNWRGGDWRDLLTSDQAVWLRYAERYEHLVILEVRPEGMTDDVLVLTGNGDGSIAWHLIDRDGVELWCKAPEELANDMPPGGPMPGPGSEANDERHFPDHGSLHARRA